MMPSVLFFHGSFSKPERIASWQERLAAAGEVAARALQWYTALAPR